MSATVARLLFVACLAGLNLALGLALAHAVGRGPRWGALAWQVLGDAARLLAGLWRRVGGSSAAARGWFRWWPWPKQAKKSAGRKATRRGAPTNAGEYAVEGFLPEAGDAAGVDISLGDESAPGDASSENDKLLWNVAHRGQDDHASDGALSADLPDRGPWERFVDQAQSELDRFFADLSQCDRRFRSARRLASDGDGATFTSELHELTHRAQRALEQALAPLRECHDDALAVADAREQLFSTFDGLRLQTHAALGLLEGDPGGAAAGSDLATRLPRVIQKLAECWRRILALWESPLVVLLDERPGFERLAARFATEPTHNLTGRLAFEAALRQLRGQPSAAPALFVALLDVDQLDKFNQQHGLVAGDLLLESLTRMLRAGGSAQRLTTRLVGQQFALVCQHGSLAAAAKFVESLRQTVEKARFSHAGGEMRVTLSAAVAGVPFETSGDEVLAQLRNAAREAKLFGRNRTFLCEGECVTPVAPLDLVIAEQSVAL